jgi:hypothetical protein
LDVVSANALKNLKDLTQKNAELQNTISETRKKANATPEGTKERAFYEQQLFDLNLEDKK